MKAYIITLHLVLLLAFFFYENDKDVVNKTQREQIAYSVAAMRCFDAKKVSHNIACERLQKTEEDFTADDWTCRNCRPEWGYGYIAGKAFSSSVTLDRNGSLLDYTQN